MIDMNKIGNYIKEERKKSWINTGRICHEIRIRLTFCKRIRTGKGNCAYGQSKSGIGNVRERSCTGRKGGITSGVRI
jgi:hypothetical protein